MKIDFLNGELEEEMYMMQPKGFTSTDESKMCKLQRSIYRLKQASRSWNLCFDKAIKTYGFIRNEEEPKAHHCTKYILHRYHLIREIVDRGDVELQKIDGRKNMADSFTKAVTIKKFDNFKIKMGIRYCSNWL